MITGMKVRKIGGGCLFLLMQVFIMAAAAGPASPAMMIPKTEQSVKIDGKLDEPAWAEAWTYELKYEVQPGENLPAPVKTEVLALYDRENVYFAFRAYDPEPGKLHAHLADHDQLGNDDWVGVVLDTFNDQRRSFDFIVNPLGVQLDQIETGTSNMREWDAIWDSAGQITDWGYSVEMRIPFSSLRFPRRNGAPQIWGFDAVRGWPREQFRQMGSFPRDRKNNCYFCQMIKIEGFDGVTPGRNLEITPTLTAVRTDVRKDFPDGPLEKDTRKVEGGVTAHWGITPNIFLSGTLNPDFSQVEADAWQLDINEPFALYYSEKRPFFLEGSDYFNSPFQAVYTRVMRNPDWGIKLTGKESGNTLGGYVVRDALTNLIFPGNKGSRSTSLALPSTDAVFRYRRDIGSHYTLGALFTGRESEGYSNRLGGVDGELKFTRQDSISFQLLRSSTRYPGGIAAEFGQPAGNFSDWAIHASYEHQGRNLSWWGIYEDVGDGFRADLGFMPKVDYRGYLGATRYRWFPEKKSWYSQMFVEAQFLLHESQSGELLDKSGTFTFQYEGLPLTSHSRVQAVWKRERFLQREYSGNTLNLHQCMNPNKDSHLYCNLILGGRVDYLNARQGRRLRINPGINYNIGKHLLWDIGHTYEHLNVDAGRLYHVNLTQTSLVYQFNTRTMLRSIIQYDSSRYHPERYLVPVPAVSKDFFLQLLFSYKINPQTVLFLGYSGNSTGDRSIPLTQHDRTFFMKIGYAWRM